MVKIKESFTYLADNTLDIEHWLDKVKAAYHLDNVDLLRRTYLLAQPWAQGITSFYGRPCLEQGLEVAEILLKLKLDTDTVCAGMLSAALPLSHFPEDKMRKELGDNITKLIIGVEKTALISALQKQKAGNQVQIDKIRKMLLAMATDIRVVMIKLAERLAFMRGIKVIPQENRQKFAQEIIDIYAPLANRLGIGQIKWELEDLALRYQHPATYKSIAEFLVERRTDREARIQQLIQQLKSKLHDSHINGEISGRAKHIYSIYLKMQRKDISQAGIYDHSAIRVLVSSVEDCYKVLSIVNSLWPPILNEFDDYIANPKPNGYRSIHTAIEDHDGKQFEIQIRTHDMHEESERGVAAHWMYKERRHSSTDDQTKITYLRQLIDWHQEIANNNERIDSRLLHVMDDGVYVMTPAGDILDLPKGSTPIDFAYHIHSEVGHHCRGAKINGHIVPLTYTLKTGESVDIHTIAEGGPSRDWLNPELGYIKTSRARSKIMQWFKQQEAAHHSDDSKLASEKEQPRKKPLKPTHTSSKPIVTTNNIIGASGLLTRYAKCCKPIPGDTIIGYITQGSGISVHKKSCPNTANLTNPDRFIAVDWNQKKSTAFITDLKILTADQDNILHELTALFVQEKVKLFNLNANAKKDHGRIAIIASIQVLSLEQLQHIKHRIKQLPGVLETTRVKH